MRSSETSQKSGRLPFNRPLHAKFFRLRKVNSEFARLLTHDRAGAAARTIATMPALTASGSASHAAITSARSESVGDAGAWGEDVSGIELGKSAPDSAPLCALPSKNIVFFGSVRIPLRPLSLFVVDSRVFASARKTPVFLGIFIDWCESVRTVAVCAAPLRIGARVKHRTNRLAADVGRPVRVRLRSDAQTSEQTGLDQLPAHCPLEDRASHEHRPS